MNITPELLTGLGYSRDKLGCWSHRDLDFYGTVTEYDGDDGVGVGYYAFDCKIISTADELLNCIFEAGIKAGQKRSAEDFRRLIGLRGEG